MFATQYVRTNAYTNDGFVRWRMCCFFSSLFVLFEQRIVILMYKLVQTPIQIGIRVLDTLLKMIGIRFQTARERENGKKEIRNRNQFTSELIQQH